MLTKQKNNKLVKILAVDDIESYRATIKNLLLAMKCSVTTAIDGENAWYKIEDAASKNDPFDIIISDWQMPYLDGLELLKKVRESEYRKTIFILLTTEPDALAVRNAQKLYKPDAVLGKPAEQHKDLFKVYVDALE